MRDVVAISDISKTDILDIPEALVQREVICQRLARMLQLTQGVDDRNACILRHAFDCAVRESAQDNAIHPALEVVSDVAQLFPRVETPLRLIDERRPATHASHSCFECYA